MPNPLRIAMIGTDNSRAVAFTRLLHDPQQPGHVPGGIIAAAYPGEKVADFAMSYDRLDDFTRRLREDWGVRIAATPEAAADGCDALMLEMVDGRSRLSMLRRLLPLGKPIFIDKPLALGGKDAEQMLEEARRWNVPVMSSSALRYAGALSAALSPERRREAGAVIGADFYGPLALEATQPGLFWYGIHLAEMLYRAMGTGCRYVQAVVTEGCEMVGAVWEDGRIGSIRGNKGGGNSPYGGVIHHEKDSFSLEVRSGAGNCFSAQLERIIHFFATGESDVEPAEMAEMIRFIEAANQSRVTGKRVRLI